MGNVSSYWLKSSFHLCLPFLWFNFEQKKPAEIPRVKNNLLGQWWMVQSISFVLPEGSEGNTIVPRWKSVLWKIFTKERIPQKPKISPEPSLTWSNWIPTYGTKSQIATKRLVAPVPDPDPQDLKELEILHALRGWVLSLFCCCCYFFPRRRNWVC